MALSAELMAAAKMMRSISAGIVDEGHELSQLGGIKITYEGYAHELSRLAGRLEKGEIEAGQVKFSRKHTKITKTANNNTVHIFIAKETILRKEGRRKSEDGRQLFSRSVWRKGLKKDFAKNQAKFTQQQRGLGGVDSIQIVFYFRCRRF